MTDFEQDLVQLSFGSVEALWEAWAPEGDDVLAHAAYERTMRWAIGLEEEGLYFRPGGWTINLPSTLVRIACASAILAAGFQIAGLDDLGREIIITAAGLTSAMDLRPVQLTRDDRLLVESMRKWALEDLRITAKEVREILPRRLRKQATRERVADALDRLVAAGIADRAGSDEYILRAAGSEAWIRISLGRV